MSNYKRRYKDPVAAYFLSTGKVLHYRLKQHKHSTVCIVFHFYWMCVAKEQNWNISFEPEASWEHGTAYVVNVFHFRKD